MSVRVVNKYKEPDHVYCGRFTPVGNPFPMKDKSVAERNRVCDEYEDWFNKKMFEKHNKVTQFVNELVLLASVSDLNLGCFCAPKRCHCDTIKDYIDNRLKKL